MKTARIRLSALIEDPSIYPRASVFSGHIAELEESLRAGARLPLVIVEATTRRIVDGIHRTRVFRRVLGPDAEIEVELRSYATDAELFEDAVRSNAHHGRRLSSFDMARTSRIAETLGIDPDAIASVLSVRPEKLAQVRAVKEAVAPDGLPVPIRRGLAHLAGRRLTPRQVAAARRIGGHPVRYLLEQIIEILEADALPEEDAALQNRLARLRDLLLERLPVAGAPSPFPEPLSPVTAS